MPQTSDTYYKRDFWSSENLKYVRPHFRMEKAARIINSISRGKECDLLDVGCGPATLRQLLKSNIHYHGIDIAIHSPDKNLIQADFLDTPIKFGEKKFDIIVAQGVCEYIGNFQSQKFSEIAKILKEEGALVVTYVNFDHRNKNVYWPYNNIQSFEDFQKGLARFFHIDRFFPTSHRWHHDEPKGRVMKAIQMHINGNIPFFSRLFAVEYFFICSLQSPRKSESRTQRR
jgi:SAM-dependent methyltransferase